MAWRVTADDVHILTEALIPIEHHSERTLVMMRKPLSCPECGRTETDEPVGGMLTAGLSGALIGGLDPHHCGGCWDVVNASDCALPHVVHGQQYDVWDAHTSDGRWWVITNPVNLYSQDQIKSMDIALSFHIGLMSRVMASRPLPAARQGAWMLEVARRLDVASESLDRAREVEDFQAVGMRLRETLLTLAARLAGAGPLWC